MGSAGDVEFKVRDAIVGSSWRPNWLGVIIGSAIALGALWISLGTLEVASRGGGTYVLLWGAVLAGAGIAIRSLARTRGSMERDALRRAGEANMAILKRAMTPAQWQDARDRHDLGAGRILPEWEVATRVLAENRAREEEGAARWRANVKKV